MTDTLLHEATRALSDPVLSWFAVFLLVALGIGATLFWVSRRETRNFDRKLRSSHHR